MTYRQITVKFLVNESTSERWAQAVASDMESSMRDAFHDFTEKCGNGKLPDAQYGDIRFEFDSTSGPRTEVVYA